MHNSKQILKRNMRDWILLSIVTIGIGIVGNIGTDALLCWLHGVMVGLMFGWSAVIALMWVHFHIYQLDKELEELEKEEKENN